MPPEPRRVVIGRVQRQPRHRPVARPDPVGQQRRLAEPGRGTHQDQPPGQPLIQRLHQPRAGHQPRPRAGHVQLGGQQDILLGRGSRGRGRRLGSAIGDPPLRHPASASVPAGRGQSTGRSPVDQKGGGGGERPRPLAERYLAASGCHLLGQVQRAQGRLGALAPGEDGLFQAGYPGFTVVQGNLAELVEDRGGGGVDQGDRPARIWMTGRSDSGMVRNMGGTSSSLNGIRYSSATSAGSGCHPLPVTQLHHDRRDDVAGAGRVVVQQAQALFRPAVAPISSRSSRSAAAVASSPRSRRPPGRANWPGCPRSPGRAAGQPEGRTVLAVADSDRDRRRAPAVQRDGDAGERAQGLGDLIHSGRLVARGKRFASLSTSTSPSTLRSYVPGLVTGIIAITAVDPGGRCERCRRAVTLLSIRSAPDGAV